MSSIIELNAAQEDLGKVIEKQGRIAQAIRVILHAAGMKLIEKSVLSPDGSFNNPTIAVTIPVF